MATITSPSATSPKKQPWFCPTVWLKPHLTVFNLTVAVVLGAGTAGFLALIAVLVIITTNFSVIGFIE